MTIENVVMVIVGLCKVGSGVTINMTELATDYELFYHRLSFAGTKSQKWRDGILN